MAKNLFTYEIDENNAVRIWNENTRNEANDPDIFQPWHPATPHESWTKEEATAWAEEIIANLLNPPKEDPTSVVIQGEVVTDPVK